MKPRFQRLRRLSALLGVTSLVSAAFAYTSRRSWGPGMIVRAPSPEYSAGPLPEGVSRALEVERGDARVRAWVAEPSSPLRGTLVLLHGIRDSKSSLLPSARRHAESGFRTLAVDSRGHGESSGRYLTYGVREAEDLRALLDVAETEGILRHPLIVLGTSYGAATAIQHAALDARVDLTLAIAPFASLEEVVPAYVKWILGPLAALVPEGAVDDVLEECATIADFDPAAASPLAVAPSIRTPVRLLHSRDDERIPIAHARAIASALQDGELVEYSGASHTESGAHPEALAQIEEWLDEAAPRRSAQNTR